MMLLSACTSKKEPATIKVIVLPYMSNAPFFIARDEGFYEEQGLTVEIVEMTSNLSETIPVLNQGDVDVVSGAISSGFFNALARGANLKMVADKGQIATTGCSAMVLLASNAFLEAHPSKNPADLKGALVNGTRTSFSGYYYEEYLKEANLSLDDLEWFKGRTPDAFQAIQEGTLDIMITTEPWKARVLQGGYGNIWLEFKDIFPGFTYGQVWFGPTFLEDNPEIGERFMVAYLKGVAQFNLGKTDRNIEIIANYTELDKELVSDACWITINNDGNINIQDTMLFQEWALKEGLQDEIIPEEKFWDSHFIEYAAKELGLP